MKKSTPKIYVVRWARHRITETTERFVRGTAEQIAEYCGVKATSIRSILSKWQKELDRRYECTYTRVSVDQVDTVPEGASVNDLSVRVA